MDALLRELLAAPGIAGYEDRVRDLIAERLPAGVARTTDSMGNLIASLGAAAPGASDASSSSTSNGVMFVAHMDEIGFVISDVRDDGYLSLRPLGGIDPRTVYGRALRVITTTGEVMGVIGVKPPHLMTDRAREMAEVPPIAEMLVDVGARSGEEAASLGIAVLDFAVLKKDPVVLHNDLWSARALDDRVGCYILLRALERLEAHTFSRPVHFAFSVQEEIGLRGASRLARAFDLDYAFAVDSVSTADWPGVSRALSGAVVGAGAALRVLDNATVIPPAFRREIATVAEREEIPLQVVFTGGGTDAKPFQAEGPQVMSLAIPMRYTHAAVELVSGRDVEHVIRLVVALARHYAA